MKLRIRSDLHELNHAIAQSYEASGAGTAEVRGERCDSYELRHSKGLSMASLAPVLDALRPLLPPTRAVDELGDTDVELRLGMRASRDDYRLAIHGNSERICEHLAGLLGPVGLAAESHRLGRQDGNVLEYGGAPLMLRQLLRWLLVQEGVEVRETKEWGDDDQDVWLHVRDPEQEGRPAREYVNVVVETDDLTASQPLLDALRARGFVRVQARPLTINGAWGRRFLVHPGPLAWEDGGMETALLDVSLGELLEQQAVDGQRFPVERHEEGEDNEARLSVPLRAWRSGELRPYAGSHSERFDLRIRTEETDAAASLRQSLHDAGFPHVLVEQADPEELVGYRISWGAIASETALAGRVRATVEAEMERIGASDAFSLAVRETEDDDQEVIIDFPIGGIADGDLLARILATASQFDVSLRTATAPMVEPLLAALRDLGFERANHLEHHDVDTARISFGGAPPALVARVRDTVKLHAGVDCSMEKAWEDYDNDVWIDLPESSADVSAHDPGVELDLGSWLVDGDDRDDAATRPFVAVDAEQAHIGRVELPRWTGDDAHLAPPLAAFAHYCIDELTAATLEHVALGVALREPVLLEGETSTSKTSSILYLAALLGQPAVRINLNGQTDTGELIGRYVPDDLRTEMPPSRDDLASHGDRPLSPVEVQQLTANEGTRNHPWRWQDGLLVQALRRGWWVILDELNLAEPQILERLNSVLEREPSLVLTEHDNSVIGHGGEPVHHGFRIFGTMNPAEYAGRSVLSPAYRDRWVGYRHVPTPTEDAYLAMLRLLVWGEQPPVAVLGRHWQASAVDPPLGALAELPGLAEFLTALARFHGGLQSAVGGTGAGARRLGQGAREPYVFTRRGLLRVMEYLASVVARDGRDRAQHRMRQALMRYYLGRMRSRADQAMLAQLLDAAGIGPTTWQPGRESDP